MGGGRGAGLRGNALLGPHPESAGILVAVQLEQAFSIVAFLMQDLAPSCIAECPDICPHLQTLVMQALMNIDPLPYVCTNSETFVCMDTRACDSLLDTAESYDLFHVPRSEKELQDSCHVCTLRAS